MIDVIAVARTPGDPWVAFWIGVIVVVVMLAETFAIPWLARYQRRHHAHRAGPPAGRRTHGPEPDPDAGDLLPSVVPQLGQQAATDPAETVSDALPGALFDLSAEPGATFRV